MLNDQEIDLLLEQEYPGKFYARLMDIKEQIQMQLRESSLSDNYKTQYRLLLKGIVDLTDTYSYYVHGEWDDKIRKHVN